MLILLTHPSLTTSSVTRDLLSFCSHHDTAATQLYTLSLHDALPIYPQFPEIVKAAKEMGFPQVQVATNGIRLATEDGFFDKVAEAGLNTIYLQFDGLREENYIKARGRPLLDVKLKVIERVRERKG